MKAIMITIKPEHACNIMNLFKTIEVRKNEPLVKAVNKLIAMYGKARIYVCVSKANNGYLSLCGDEYMFCTKKDFREIGHNFEYFKEKKDDLCGKVAFMFECEKVEDIAFERLVNNPSDTLCFYTDDMPVDEIYEASCLNEYELFDYLKPKKAGGEVCGYTLPIQNLTIFDEPKEIGEFKRRIEKKHFVDNATLYCLKPLTKAPQNYCWIEVEE